MATLVLTTIGTAVGGPIGGAIGAVLGSAVDQRLLAPRARGARLGALTVQTSAYGQPIAKLFGTLRVAGTVIWATDLREDRSRSGGSKGKPSVTTYSYSASFAVALSGRPIRAVHRIWADGKLLRGAAGDWKSETGFRLHVGDEDQNVDPLIAAAEGTAATPAYRGMAYAVFEDMQLADFGNRIPSLTFEVEADAEAVPVGGIAADLAGEGVVGDTTALLGGYAAGGESVRGAIEALGEAIPLSLQDDGVRLVISDAVPAATAVGEAELGTGSGGDRRDRRPVDRRAAGTLPDEVTVTYYEPERDYQAGLQRARRGGPGRRIEAIELAAAMPAGVAKALAERRLAETWAMRTTASAMLPWRRLDLRPGGRVTLGGAEEWRIAGWTLEAMVLSLTLRGTNTQTSPAVSAQPGRATAGDDAAHGPTHLALLDLPPLDESAMGPRLWLAANGPSSGWRRAAVIASRDNGGSWFDLGTTAGRAAIGTARDILAPGDSAMLDLVHGVEVELIDAAQSLASRTDDALVGGANLAMLGSELIQFGEATWLGDGRWRLRRLLRGRRGTEAAMAGHAIGDCFVMIDADDLLPIELAADQIGARLHVIATGVGDPIGVSANALVTGRALLPPAPVHLRAQPIADGGLRFGWTRRGRTGWAWTDGGDVPLGEEGERYRLTIAPASGTTRTIEIDTATYDYTASEVAADGGAEATSFTITIAQLGTFGASPEPASATFTRYGDRT